MKESGIFLPQSGKQVGVRNVAESHYIVNQVCEAQWFHGREMHIHVFNALFLSCFQLISDITIEKGFVYVF